jgi:hypothetical protein
MTIDDALNGDPGSDGAGDGSGHDPAAQPEGTDGVRANEDGQQAMAVQLAALQARNEMLERMLQQGAQVADGRGAGHTPTPDSERANYDPLETELVALAARKDPAAVAVLRLKQQYAEQLQHIQNTAGHALAAMNEKLELMAMSEADRGDFRAFLDKNRHRFADFEAARLAYAGMRASNATSATKKPQTVVRQSAEPAARQALVSDVETGVRPIPRRELAERVLDEAQFNAQLEKLRDDHRHDEARNLLSRARELPDGRIAIDP